MPEGNRVRFWHSLLLGSSICKYADMQIVVAGHLLQLWNGATETFKPI